MGKLAVITTKEGELQEDLYPVTIPEGVIDPKDKTPLSNDLHKIKDKEYNKPDYSGLGRVFLKKNIKEGRNILTQDMINKLNSIYIIEYDFDLNGEEVTIPEGCVLDFQGGSLNNGILLGELYTVKPLTASNIGIIYNSISHSDYNSKCLSILSGITNNPKLQLEDSLYISGDLTNVLFNNININGNGNTIFLNGFNTLNVKKDISICNTVVDSINKNTPSMLFKLPNNDYLSSIDINNCTFKGNIQVLHSQKKKTNESDVKDCIISLNIYNNNFEDIHYINSPFDGVLSIIFFLQNTNIKNANINNNNIHNFYGTFLDASITNFSLYEEVITDYYKNKGRVFNIKNNVFHNDLGFKPWETINSARITAYFTAFLIEVGDVYIQNNTFENFITSHNDIAVYDNYISVNKVYYHKNKWRNCINLSNDDELNTLIKAKSSGELRDYSYNEYYFDDISVLFDVDINLISPTIVTQNYRTVWEIFDFRNNIVKAQTINTKLSADIVCRNINIENNDIIIENLENASGNIFNIGNYNGCNFILNNNKITINKGGDNVYVASVPENIWSEDYYYRYVKIINNNIENCNILRCYCNQKSSIIGEIYNNNIIFSDKDYCLVWSPFTNVDDITIYNNTILYKNKVYSNKGLFRERAFKFKNKFVFESGVKYLFNFSNYSSSIIACILKFSNIIKGKTVNAQINYNRNNNTSVIFGTNNIQKVVNTGESFIFGFTSAFDLAVKTSTTALAINSLIENNFIEIEFMPDIVDFDTAFTIYPNYISNEQKGAVATGSLAYNLSFNKLMYYKETKWLDSNGYTPASNGGISNYRPALETTDIGYIYYDTTLNKPIWWTGTKWVDATGADV